MDDIEHLDSIFMTWLDNNEIIDEDEMFDDLDLKRIAVAIDATQQFFFDNHINDFIQQLPDATEYHVITFDKDIIQMSVFNNKNHIKSLTKNMLISSGPCLNVVNNFRIHNQYNEIYVFSDGYFVDDCDKTKMIFYSPKKNKSVDNIKLINDKISLKSKLISVNETF